VLDSVSDFKYVSVSGISGFLTDGEGLVDPLPIRLGCEGDLPFESDSELDEYAGGDLRVIDPAWLLEAVQERESFLLNYADQVPSSVFTAPRVKSSELLAVATALETWARRWDSGQYTGVFVKPEAEDEISEDWTDVIAVTFTTEFEENDRNEYPPVSRFQDRIAAWTPSDEDSKEIYPNDGIVENLKKHALRDYLSVPRMLGVEPDDHDGTFSWKTVTDWTGTFPPTVKASDVLALYSDLEKTRCAVLDFDCTNYYTPVSYKNDVSEDDKSDSYNLQVDHSIISHSIDRISWTGCASFSEGDHTITSSSTNTPTKGTRQVTISPATSYLTWASWMASVSDTRGLVGKNEVTSVYHHEEHVPYCCLSQRTYFCPTCYSENKLCSTRTSKSISSLPSLVDDNKDETVHEYEPEDDIEMDVTEDYYSSLIPSERTGIEIESASVVIASVAVKYKQSYKRDWNTGAFQTPTSDYGYAEDTRITSRCDVNVRLKRMQCTIRDGHVLVVSLPDVDSIPEATGGKNVEIDLAYPTTVVPGSRIKTVPWSVNNTDTEGQRRAIIGVGPVFVKFKPKTLVGED